MGTTESTAVGRPVLFRDGLVLTMDDAHRVLPDTDVLVLANGSQRSGSA